MIPAAGRELRRARQVDNTLRHFRLARVRIVCFRSSSICRATKSRHRFVDSLTIGGRMSGIDYDQLHYVIGRRENYCAILLRWSRARAIHESDLRYSSFGGRGGGGEHVISLSRTDACGILSQLETDSVGQREGSIIATCGASRGVYTVFMIRVFCNLVRPRRYTIRRVESRNPTVNSANSGHGARAGRHASVTLPRNFPRTMRGLAVVDMESVRH